MQMHTREFPTMPEITFTTNWNNKLINNAFTALRRPSRKYWEGAVMEATCYTNGKFHCTYGLVELKGIVSINPVSSINLFTSYIDTGYSPDETLNIIRKMYSKEPDILDKEFWLLLFVKVK